MMLEEKFAQELLVPHFHPMFQEIEVWKSERTDFKVWQERQKNNLSFNMELGNSIGERQEIFQAIAEASPIPIIISRLSDGAILYANALSSELFKFSLNQAKTLTTFEFYQDLETRQRLIEKIVTEGCVHNYELEVKKTDGTTFWVMGSFQGVLIQRERAVLSIFHDITDRKQTEKALQTSTERLYRQSIALRDLSQETTINCDNLDHAIRKITETAAQTLEVERVSVWLSTTIHYGLFNQQQNCDYQFITQLENEHPLKPSIDFESSSPINNLEWVCLDWYEQSCDRHWSEQILTTKPDLPDFTVQFKPPSFYSEEGLPGLFFSDSASPASPPLSFFPFPSSPIQPAHRLDVPIWLNGKIVGFICVESPTHLSECRLEDRAFVDSLANLVALAIERFERRKAENILSQVKADLEISIEKRTAEMRAAVQELRSEMVERLKIEAALQQALAKAEEASQAKSTFLAKMSHELRTPLHAIIGFSDLLLEEFVDRNLNDLLPDIQRVRQSGSHLLTMINEILDLCKMEAGEMLLKHETFDIANLIHEVVTSLQPLANLHKNRLQICCKNNLDLMTSDQVKVKQILYNLLSNGLKFTQQGQVTLTVHRERNGNSDWICFQVTDNGIGISLEKQQTLFEAFTQADNSLSRQHGGTGLGLTITHHYCKMMEGQIQVVSQLGVGSTFTVYLPAQPKNSNQ